MTNTEIPSCFIYFDRKHGMYLSVRDERGNVEFPWNDYEPTLPGAYKRAKRDGYDPQVHTID